MIAFAISPFAIERQIIALAYCASFQLASIDCCHITPLLYFRQADIFKEPLPADTPHTPHCLHSSLLISLHEIASHDAIYAATIFALRSWRYCFHAIALMLH
jgi:hypothetical protein